MEIDRKRQVDCWVRKTFGDYCFDTINVEFPGYDAKGGSLGNILFVDVIGRQKNGEIIFNLVIKQSKSDTISLDVLNLRVAYLNEINFYSKIVPFLKKFAEDRKSTTFQNLPQCYGTIVEENLYVVLLENLKPKGFMMHEIDKPQDLTCAKLVLEAYAKWHALSLAVKDQEPIEFEELAKNVEDFQKKKIVKLSIASTKKELEFVIGLYEQKGELETAKKIRYVKEHYEDYYYQSLSAQNYDYHVIRHGDCWNNNFLFTKSDGMLSPEKVMVIDWQNCSLGPPLADVVQYILSSCCESVYDHIEKLLNFYHDVLSKKLIELGSKPAKCFSLEDCFNDFKKCLLPSVFNRPVFLRASLATGFNPDFDIRQSPDDGNFHGMFLDGLKDTEEYFNRFDYTLKIFINKGFLNIPQYYQS